MHFPCTPIIIALSESNLNPNKLNKINIDGFNFVSSNEFITHRGVSLYIDKNISFTIQDDLNLLCNKCENVWKKISLNERKFVIVGVIYRHPDYDFKEFCNCITKKNILKLTYNMYTFVICGDINIDLLKYDKDTKVNNYANDITSMGCIIPIDRSTRITETGSFLY